MYRPVVAIVSIIAGSAAAAAAIHVQRNPAAFTSIKSDAPAFDVPVRVEPVPASFAEYEGDRSFVSSAPAKAKRVRGPTAAPPKSGLAEPVFAPCSDWREVGVQALAGPDGPDPRHVRMLCK